MKQSSLRLLFLIIVSIRSFLLGPMMHFPRTLCIFSLELKLSIQHNWTVLVNPLAYFNWQTSIHEYNTMDHGKHKQEKNVPCATPFLRGVEFFLHWKRGERKGTAQGTILLLFLFITTMFKWFSYFQNVTVSIPCSSQEYSAQATKNVVVEKIDESWRWLHELDYE